MKLKNLSVIVLGSLCLASMAHANEVLLTANQPIKITFRVAHKNKNNQTVFGKVQSVDVNKNMTVPISVPLDDYDKAGIVIVSGDGHELPPSANQFDAPNQCSMTTDKSRAMGTIAFTMAPHTISCKITGGVYG